MVMTVEEAGKRRWKSVSKAERARLMQQASRKFWDSLTPEQRSAEMKRRAKKRKKPTMRAPK